MTQTKSGPPRAIGYFRVSTKDQGENGFGLEADGRPPHPDTIRQRFDRLAAAAALSRITFHDYADLPVMPTSGERCCRPG